MVVYSRADVLEAGFDDFLKSSFSTATPVTVVILSTGIVYGNVCSGELSVKKPSGYW